MYLPWLKIYNLLAFDEIDSTNSEGVRLAKAGISGDHIIWAASQTAGRGRYGRSWESESGNLYLSLLLDRNIDSSVQSQLSFVTSLAVRAAILELAGSRSNLKITLKWPNDVLIEGKKVAGILLESLTVNGSLSKKNYLVIGVGINILSHPTNIDKPTTSLLAEGIVVKKYGQELSSFMSHFEKYFAAWQRLGFEKIRGEWLKCAESLGELITVNDGVNSVSGVFRGLGAEGALSLELASGEIYNVSAGEIFFGNSTN